MLWNWAGRWALLSLLLVSCSKQGRSSSDQPLTADRVTAPAAPAEPREPSDWFDPRPLLVKSNGTHQLGGDQRENTSRDPGSKLLYFDVTRGDNETAEVYWWDGHRIVDSKGRPGLDGKAYGTDPLSPNEAAIRPFATATGLTGNAEGDPRLRTHGDGFEAVAGGYPDWFLFRRGQVHDTFDGLLVGGRSEAEPMVVAGYGPLADGRASIHPKSRELSYRGAPRPSLNPFSGHNSWVPSSRVHLVLLGLDFNQEWTLPGVHLSESPAGGPTTARFEDCRFAGGNAGVIYIPQKSTFRRCIFTGRWNAERHNQAYYVEGFRAETTFEDSVFYRNGFKTDPRRDPDPKRDIFSRNIYAGGGKRMGHTFRGVISADGASGGPQMRLGGLCEGSLILEGYWFSGTQSNSSSNPWLQDQREGSSAIVRNNVQLVYQYPTPKDPDNEGASDKSAQPGWGYSLQGASYGSVVEGNIISGAMLLRELGVEEEDGAGFALAAKPLVYEAGSFTLQRNLIRNNIVYARGSGLALSGDWTGSHGTVVEGNVFATTQAFTSEGGGPSEPGQLVLRNNRFYLVDDELPSSPLLGEGNRVAERASVAEAEHWPDPDRTLRRYVTEVLGLSLLDWNDDPSIDQGAKTVRSQAAEPYDPTGMKTFMAVATRMRRGGSVRAPHSGKPALDADYAWDDRFTATSVVNWIRAGFGWPALPAP